MRIKSHLIFTFLVAFVTLISLPLGKVQGQSGEPTAIVDVAYSDLSVRLGVTVVRQGTALRPTTFSWTTQVYSDASLDCPAAGMYYTVGDVSGYQILISYAGQTYDYRAKADGSVVFLCSANSRAPGGLAAPPTAIPAASDTSNNTDNNAANNASASITANGAPLTITLNGDQWQWNDTTAQLKQGTQWGYNAQAILAPNGATIAYKSTAKFVVDAAASGKNVYTEGDLPANIWLLNLATGDSWRIADQPADASFSSGYIIRSDPSWSPDGAEVAWAELQLDHNTPTNRLIIYSLRDATSRSFPISATPEYPMGGGGELAHTVYWGKPGIAVRNISQNPSTGLKSEITLYSPAGQQLATGAFPDPESSLVWISAGNQDLLAAVSVTSGTIPQPGLKWMVLDFVSGSVAVLNGTPELYCLTAPSGLRIYPTTDQQNKTIWHIANGATDEGTITTPINSYIFMRSLAIAPDGRSIAYASGQEAYVEKLGSSRVVAKGNANQSISVVWGPTAWRVQQIH